MLMELLCSLVGPSRALMQPLPCMQSLYAIFVCSLCMQSLYAILGTLGTWVAPCENPGAPILCMQSLYAIFVCNLRYLRYLGGTSKKS